MQPRVVHLVVDSGAFIKNCPIHEYAENIYTVDGAVKEIKDKATKHRLQVLPYKLQLKDPEPENYKYVLEFSKKTGDYCNLSATDLKIIALTYQLEKTIVGTEHLHEKPTYQITDTQHLGQQLPEGFYCPDEDDEADEAESSDCYKNEISNSPAENSHLIEQNLDFSSVNAEKDGDIQKSSDGDDEEDCQSSDEYESWITPSNLAEVQKRMSNLDLDSNASVTVACVTTDFAIQNVLLQMGLHVVSVDGMLIRHVKVFILRCHSCFKSTTIMTKKFCPSCGNPTLKRVSVSVNEDGSKQIHINYKRPIKIRGTKYSLPKPCGGKHAKNPIICADQPLPQNKPPKSALEKMDVFSPDYVASVSPFAMHDVYSRAASFGIYGMNNNQRGRRNPNEWSTNTGNKKNKRSR